MILTSIRLWSWTLVDCPDLILWSSTLKSRTTSDRSYLFCLQWSVFLLSLSTKFGGESKESKYRQEDRSRDWDRGGEGLDSSLVFKIFYIVITPILLWTTIVLCKQNLFPLYGSATWDYCCAWPLTEQVQVSWSLSPSPSSIFHGEVISSCVATTGLPLSFDLTLVTYGYTVFTLFP